MKKHKSMTLRGTMIRITIYLSSEVKQAEKHGNIELYIRYTMKKKNHRILYPEELSFKRG